MNNTSLLGEDHDQAVQVLKQVGNNVVMVVARKVPALPALQPPQHPSGASDMSSTDGANALLQSTQAESGSTTAHAAVTNEMANGIAGSQLKVNKSPTDKQEVDESDMEEPRYVA